jgi:hypothetical protein
VLIGRGGIHGSCDDEKDCCLLIVSVALAGGGDRQSAQRLVVWAAGMPSDVEGKVPTVGG